MRDLTERLDALKSLDSKIVDEEIKTEKASQPLPEDIR
jgi:hypothetical protein